VPRLGYCDYNCTACIDICPTDAISALTIEEKQITPIGLARIDQNRCLPWAYLTSCIICEEACPLPEKAVKFQEQYVIDHKGEEIMIKRPYIVRDFCIGCGICEHKCPLTGEAAIQVYTLPKNINFLFPPGY
jgi:Pyruvate/2-oxoacid:ferredoxin oxidoreductase delta subunit